ncbi:MAG: Phage portal protein BeeE [Rhodoglobus sp.]|nr:Phage portal protein BeeE [Rhodoglobus sp.]
MSSPIDLGIASPWQEGSLQQILIADLLGAQLADTLPLGRAEAISIPAVAKARNLLVSSVSKFPLRALRRPVGVPYSRSDADDDVTGEYAWLYRTNGPVSPHERMTYTVDDGYFHGLALWLVDRSAPDENRLGAILNADYCPWDAWTVDDGKILVNDKPVDESEIILFNFPTDGILVEGRKTIRGARDTEAAWTGRMRNPIPLIELDVTDPDINLTQPEIDKYVTDWAFARRQENGAVGFTPPGISLNTHGEVHADLYVEARNAIRTDIGSFSNIRASMLDGTMGVDSLTYKTETGERNQFYEFDLPFWTDPIEARLSQDDVVSRGTRVRFDKYENYSPTPTPTGAPTED